MLLLKLFSEIIPFLYKLYNSDKDWISFTSLSLEIAAEKENNKLFIIIINKNIYLIDIIMLYSLFLC